MSIDLTYISHVSNIKIGFVSFDVSAYIFVGGG